MRCSGRISERAVLRRAFEVGGRYETRRDWMSQNSGSGNFSDNEMNIIWLDPAIGMSNPQAVRRGNHGSRGNKCAVQKLRRPFATLTLPMADQGHSLGGTGNRLFGVTSALGWLGRGLAGVRTLGVQSDLPSLNEGCANVAAICQKLSEPNATPRKRGFSFIRIARLMDKPSMRSFQGGGRG
jgi:hypothetical protein